MTSFIQLSLFILLNILVRKISFIQRYVELYLESSIVFAFFLQKQKILSSMLSLKLQKSVYHCIFPYQSFLIFGF